jgi:hypothetical protein
MKLDIARVENDLTGTAGQRRVDAEHSHWPFRINGSRTSR